MFDGLRVPFDLNMLVLAVACVAGYLALMWLTQAGTGDVILDASTPFGSPNIVSFLLGHPVPWHGFTYFLVILVSLGFWTFFSASICRIAAMKIAREETLSLADAFRFSGKKFVPVASSVLFVATIFCGFWFLNASVFGGLGRIPWVGEALVGALFFLPLIFTFFFTFALVLGIFGFNLASAAIATESSDTWDGISRSWNYILVRPWQVLLTYGLTAAYLWVFLFFAGLFMDWSVSSLTIGWWGMGDRAGVVSESSLPDSLKEYRGAEAGKKEYHVALPGKLETIRDVAFGRAEHAEKGRIYYQPTGADRERIAEKAKADKIDVVNLNGPVDVTDLLPGTLFFAGWMIWLWLWFCKLVIAGYALQYFFGATTTLYFLLRKDVEGEDYGEIVVEEEELEEEASWDVKEPAKPAPGAAPASTGPAGALLMPGAMKPAGGAANGGPGAQAAPPPSAATPSPAPAPAPTAPEGEKK